MNAFFCRRPVPVTQQPNQRQRPAGRPPPSARPASLCPAALPPSAPRLPLKETPLTASLSQCTFRTRRTFPPNPEKMTMKLAYWDIRGVSPPCSWRPTSSTRVGVVKPGSAPRPNAATVAHLCSLKPSHSSRFLGRCLAVWPTLPVRIPADGCRTGNFGTVAANAS